MPARVNHRVGIVTYGLDRAPTGIGRYTVELLRALAALEGGPEIVLLTTEREDQHGLWPRFEHHALPGCRRLPALLTLGNAALSWATRRYRLDLIHDPNGIAPFQGPAAGARRVVTIHDAFAYVRPEAQSWLDNWRYRRFLPRAARSADLILTDSAHSRGDLHRYLSIPADKMRVIACGVDARFRPASGSLDRDDVLARYGVTPPYLLYIGGINARKNLARLFEAYAQIRPAHPEVSLVIGGKRQWQTAEIDTAIRRWGHAGSVIFTGYLPDADLPAFYRSAAAFVFPSLYEGFGLPVLEAMACGTPVITSQAASLPEVTGDAALLVDPLDTTAIAKAIHRLLDDAGLAADLRARGLARAASFTWERTAQATRAAYAATLAEPR